MTGFSSPVAGGGLDALGGGLPASALMQLLARTGVSGLPGSLAPQVPTLPGAPRGAAGPLPPMPAAPQPPNTTLGALTALGNGSLGRVLAGTAASTQPFMWQASTGLFGGNGPLFGVGAPFGPGGLFGSTPATWGSVDPWSTLSAAQLGGLNAGTGMGFDTGAGALGAGAAGAASAAAAPYIDPLAAMIGFSMGGV
jgi:hypothetical protein